MRILLSLTLLFGMIASVACQSSYIITPEIPTGNTESPTSTSLHALETQELSTPDRSNDLLKKTPERVLTTPVITPITGEAPETLLDSILKDLSERSGVALDKISVYQAEAITWSDGSLGCPQLGMFYTQALVPGFRIILEIGDQKYDYHAAETGYFILCQQSLPIVFPEGTPDS